MKKQKQNNWKHLKSVSSAKIVKSVGDVIQPKNLQI